MHNGSQIAAILQLQKRISTPKRKNDDFAARFKRNFKRKIIGAKIKKKLFPKHLSHVSRCQYNAIYDSQLQNAMTLRMQLPQGATLTKPFHCDLQNTELQNTIELCTTVHKLLRFCSSQTGSRRQSGKTTILKRFERNFKRKKHQCQIKKFAAFLSSTHLTLPLQCDLRLSAAKRNSITHAQLPQRATLTQPFH